MQPDLAPDLDLRGEPRHKTYLAGRLAYGDPQITVTCTIRSLSADGAAIDLFTLAVIPETVQLLNVQAATVYEAQVIWRRHLRIGLRLTASHDLRQPVEPKVSALQAIWKELAPR